MLSAVPDFRLIPAIEAMRQRDGVRALEAAFGAAATVHALRAGASRLRDTIADGQEPASAADAAAAVEHSARQALTAGARGSLRPVINATGVVIHTNLGRAPIAAIA